MSEMMIFNKNRHERYIVRDDVVRLTGFEPAAHGVGGHCSIQLSYKRIYDPISLWNMGLYFLSYTAAVRKCVIRVDNFTSAVRHICGAYHAV